MAKLHVVSVTVGELDQPSSRVVGAFTSVEVANQVKQVTWGTDPVVTEVEIDAIDPDLLAEMRALGLETPATEVQNDSFTIEVRSTEGHDTKHSADSVEAALRQAKAARTQANRMVKILDAGNITHRWDRTNVIGENRWRKVNPGEIEILGNPAPITVKRVVRRTSV